jgi:hypothetical protein
MNNSFWKNICPLFSNDRKPTQYNYHVIAINLTIRNGKIFKDFIFC